jgi:sialidase-1
MSTGENGHRPSSIATIYSDDNGTTWHAGEIVGDGTLLNPSENTLVERSDGRVVMNIRHESEPHQRAIAISPDGISRWSSVRFDPQLPDPICMASLVRYDEKTILFSNPNNPDNRDRKNLTIRMSNDDGATWPISRTLDAGPSGYSDLAVGPDGSIYCFYERGEKKPAEKLTFARFGMDWLKPRAAPSTKGAH